jgi:hypothetical protein
MGERIRISEFRIGGVISQGFSVFFRNIGAFLVLGAIVLSPLAVLNLIYLEGFVGAGIPGADGVDPSVDIAGDDMPDPRAIGFGLAYGLLQLLLSVLLTVAAVFLTVREIRGQRASVGEALRIGLGRVLPVLGVAILVSLAIGLGFIALVVPGLILLVMFWVAVPVAVVEQPGVLASLRRSAALTRGHRWKIFAILLIMMLIAIGFSPLAGIAAWLISSVFGTFGIVVADYLWSIVVGSISAVMPAVTYHHLRAVKEGTDIDQLAAVFD